MLYQEASPHSPAAEALTISDHDDEGLLKTVSKFIIEFPDILLRAAQIRGGRISLQLVDLLTVISLKTNVLNGTSKALQNARMS